VDADCIPYKPIPENFIEGHLNGAYMALFKRRGYFSECGFWIVDGSHPQHTAVMDSWLQMYESGAFKGLPNYTDCEMLDATLRSFEKRGLIKTVSLSKNEKDMHPLATSEIGRYIDHTKGARKVCGYSPENVHRLSNEPYQLNDCK